MPNLKSLISRMMVYDKYRRDIIIAHHELLREMGFDVPGGKEIMAKLKQKEKQGSDENRDKRK